MPNQVVVVLQNGMIQVIECPSETSFVILNYDVGESTEDLDMDGDGNFYLRTVYNGKPKYEELQRTVERQRKEIKNLKESNIKTQNKLKTLRSNLTVIYS